MSVENYEYFPLCKFILDATNKAKNSLIAFAQNCKLKVELYTVFSSYMFPFFYLCARRLSENALFPQLLVIFYKKALVYL